MDPPEGSLCQPTDFLGKPTSSRMHEPFVGYVNPRNEFSGRQNFCLKGDASDFSKRRKKTPDDGTAPEPGDTICGTPPRARKGGEGSMMAAFGCSFS